MPTALVASIAFLRIQDFARRPASEQARLRAQLEAVVAVTAAELEPTKRIVLEASDGAVLVVLGDPKGTLRLAERALAAAAAGLPLCIGLNHGTVLISGSKGGEVMTGDGIAVAASIAQFAAPARLFVSRTFRDALADAQPGLEVSLSPAGTFTDAGQRNHELFKPDLNAMRRRGRRYAAAGIALVLALVGGGLAFRLSADGHPPSVDAVLAKVPHWRDFIKVAD